MWTKATLKILERLSWLSLVEIYKINIHCESKTVKKNGFIKNATAL